MIYSFKTIPLFELCSADNKAKITVHRRVRDSSGGIFEQFIGPDTGVGSIKIHGDDPNVIFYQKSFYCGSEQTPYSCKTIVDELVNEISLVMFHEQISSSKRWHPAEVKRGINIKLDYLLELYSAMVEKYGRYSYLFQGGLPADNFHHAKELVCVDSVHGKLMCSVTWDYVDTLPSYNKDWCTPIVTRRIVIADPNNEDLALEFSTQYPCVDDLVIPTVEEFLRTKRIASTVDAWLVNA